MIGAKPFYGWWILAGLFIEYMALIGIVFYTLPLFYPLLIEEYGWSPSRVTMPATFGFFAAAILTPLASPLFDRYSVRRFLVFGLSCVVLGLALYGAIAGLAFMFSLYALFALGQVFAGQVPVMVLVTRWFRQRRGLAIGIVLIAPSMGGALFPLLLRDAFGAGDWREAALILTAAGILMLGLPLLLIRNRPEEMNLLPDGARKNDSGIGLAEREGPSLRAALHTPDFYLLAFATGTLWFSMNGILQHQGIFLTREFGADTARLPLLISLFFWGAIAGKLLFGWLADRFDKLLMMLSGVVLLILGLLYLRFHEPGRGLYPYALSFGFGFGGMLTMIQLVFADYYAGSQYGRILGVLASVDIVAAGLGIPALGLLEQRLGGYLPALDVLTALTLLVAMAIGLLCRRKRPAPSRFASKTATF